MSHSFRDTSNPYAAAEASVRQLIANGNTKAAVENAKVAHKAYSTAASEALLVDAYFARIQSLNSQNLKLEAKSLEDLVNSRYPSARGRAASRRSALEEPLAPLNDPELSAERRAAIERTLLRDSHDLAAVAGCPALPDEHPLRQAAAALLKTFAAATSTVTTEEELALPEVSRRSPLAPWKMLVRAIGHFYRQEDERCRECLEAIPQDSAPARLVPAMRAMLGDASVAVTPAGAKLVAAVRGDTESLRKALERLDRTFHSEDVSEKRVIQELKAALQECSQHAPVMLEKLKQHIFVCCAMADLNPARIAPVLGGPREDAYFWRLWARTMELQGDPDTAVKACAMWETFRQNAVREGWFSPNGLEAATLYLHMAGLLRTIPQKDLEGIQRALRANKDRPSDEQIYFAFPDKLYERACALDPHPEAFSKWLDWARGQNKTEAEHVAKAWHHIRPKDIDPILSLMWAAEKKNAFPTALQYLNKAEQIDNVNPSVRRARLQLLSGSAIKHLQQKKPHLAEQRIAEMAGLPQSQQGDRPAFIAGLRFLVCSARYDRESADARRAEVEQLLGGKVAGILLLGGMALAAKTVVPELMVEPHKLDKSERAATPAAFARVVALAADMNAMKLNLPWSYITEVDKQLARDSKGLDVQQLRTLAEAGVRAGHRELAYTATKAGLERGGPADARFLLLRAQALPQGDRERSAICAAASAELARSLRDMRLVDEAVEFSREHFGPRPLTVTLDQAAEVVRKERAEVRFPRFPGDGPNYSKLFPEELCDCPDCRRERGEAAPDEDDNPFDYFDEEDDGMEALLDDLPPGLPPELARILLQEAKKGVMRGESIEQVMNRVLGGLGSRRKPRKGRKR